MKLKIEKVIKGLECCAAMSGDECRKCPYSAECRDTDLPYGMPHLAADALVLLKAQEPRLITVKDFENNPNVDHNESLPAWIEYKRDEDWSEYWEDQSDEWGICRKDSIIYKSMRYWTSRPSKEEMEAIPWN